MIALVWAQGTNYGTRNQNVSGGRATFATNRCLAKGGLGIGNRDFSIALKLPKNELLFGGQDLLLQANKVRRALICTPNRRTMIGEAEMAPQQRSRKEQRLEARVTLEQKRLIERAARLRGTTLTEFVVASAQEAATNTIKDHEVLHLRGAAQEVFVRAILNPPPPNRAARAAAKRYKERMGL